MTLCRIHQLSAFLVMGLLLSQVGCFAQHDSSHKHKLDNFILSRKGFFGEVVKNLLKDTAETELQRNDIKYQRFNGRVIRNIDVKILNFGTPITDTTKSFSNNLIRLANVLHRKTRLHIINNNLFIRKGDIVKPFLIAENERHLRDQPYLQDANITLTRVEGSRDSVDVTVLVKDVFSIGGSVTALGLNNTELSITEANFEGYGDAINVTTLFDNRRANHFGYGFEYVKRNIGGDFIDAYAGYQNFYRGISGRREEDITYLRVIKPLVNSYMRWTYALEVSNHVTSNMYSADSSFGMEGRYHYYVTDAWVGYNFNLQPKADLAQDRRLRGVVGLRVLNQQFTTIPSKYVSDYDWRYANIAGILSSISIFHLDYYKTKYIYGFGRNEDVPEGLDVSLTGGWTRKENRNRAYAGLNFQRYYFTPSRHYFNFTARVDGFVSHNHFEDMNMLANISYINRLRDIGRWKQRTFVSIGVARQFNTTLNEPLFLESDFGLPEFSNGAAGGYFRATFKSEVVLYSPGSIALFRVAPFLFYNASLFTPRPQEFSSSRLYTSLGAGLRIRNESLIFGTLELRGYFFPRQDSNGQSFKIDFNSNIKYKYNTQLIQRPDFVHVN